MYRLAVLLVIIGLALGGQATPVGILDRQTPEAIEITCTSVGTRVTVPLATTRRDGVRMRFHLGAGEWHMSAEGMPGYWKASGSAHVAEMVWPLPPGEARVLCHPSDLPTHVDPYHAAQWWADVWVLDPDRHFSSGIHGGCDSWAGMSWHGEPVLPHEEEETVWAALDMARFARRSTDQLVVSGYPDAQPRSWQVEREGRVVAHVQMSARPDGLSMPDHVSMCQDVLRGQLSIS